MNIVPFPPSASAPYRESERAAPPSPWHSLLSHCHTLGALIPFIHMSAGSEPGKAWCIIFWLIIGAVTGLLVSSVICYLQPRVYESSAFVIAEETPGRMVELSPARAAQALRLTAFQIPRTARETGLVAMVCKGTRITEKDGVVEIRVRCPDKHEARELALELSYLFRSMDEEEKLSAPVPDPAPPTEAEKTALFERMQVADLMNEECQEAGCMADFRAVPALMARGSKEAEKVWNSESFQLHREYYEDATWKIAGVPRSSLPALPLAGYPMIGDAPVSPNVDRYLQCGLYAGFALGGFIGYRRSLRIKPSNSPRDLIPAAIPAYAEVAPPPVPGSPAWKKRTPSPEDDW
jgi:hypothetical protein